MNGGRQRRRRENVHGVIPVDKPAGPSSFDVVGRLRWRTKCARAGHAGTLDPMASGLLLVCLGEATKAVPWLMEAPKSYLATLRLGESTDTDDADGQILCRREVPALTGERVAGVLDGFRGHQRQVPPLFSALKRGGERLYKKARRGEHVELEPRPVVVHELALEGLSARELRLRVRCGKGFYVRALARDIGELLGCGAHLIALRRTETAGFDVTGAEPLDALVEDDTRWRDALVSPLRALDHLPAVALDADDARRIAHGVPLVSAEPWSSAQGELPAGRPTRLLDTGDRLLAVGKSAQRPDGRWTLRVLRGFNLS